MGTKNRKNTELEELTRKYYAYAKEKPNAIALKLGKSEYIHYLRLAVAEQKLLADVVAIRDEKRALKATKKKEEKKEAKKEEKQKKSFFSFKK